MTDVGHGGTSASRNPGGVAKQDGTKMAMYGGDEALGAVPTPSTSMGRGSPSAKDLMRQGTSNLKRQGTMNSMRSTGSRRRRRMEGDGECSPSGSQQSFVSTFSSAREYRERKRMAKLMEEPKWPDPMLYNPRSLFLMTLRNPLRKACIACIEWKWWDRIVLLLIFLNTVQLGFLYDPFDIPEYRPDRSRADIFTLLGQIFSILFTIECAVKIAALGLFVGPRTYLSEAWNYLDFFIVIIGLLDFLPSGGGEGESSNGGDVSSLRTLRVMRPLRAITKFPKLRFLIVLLLQCVPMLSNVMGLCCFLFFVFGILGVQLCQGVLRGRCYNFEDGTSLDYLCTYGAGKVKCPANYECLLLAENPGNGNINFDSIGGAMVTIFLVMTMEGWAEILYWIQDAYSESMFIYFVVLIFVGPIFAIQLFLVVISNKYAQTEQSLKGLEVSTVAEGGLVEGTEDDSNLIVPPELKGTASASQSTSTTKDASAKVEKDTSEKGKRGGTENDAPPKDQSSRPKDKSGSFEITRAETGDGGSGRGSVVENSLRSMGQSAKNLALSISTATSMGEKSKSRRRQVNEKLSKKKGNVEGWRNILWQIKTLAYSEGLSNGILCVIVLNFITMAIDFDCDVCRRNNLPLGADCATYKAALEISNIVFATIFLTEMLIKIVGMGAVKYFTNRVNLFDAGIVVISLIEVEPVLIVFNCYLTSQGAADFSQITCDLDECPNKGGSNLTVLRTFRLVRIVKLLRAFPDVQKQIKIVISILGSVAALNGLILIFLLIFCILGMNIFGGGMSDGYDPELMGLGAQVYVSIPWDPSGIPRYGKVVEMDFLNHSVAPWNLEILYGREKGVNDMLGLTPEGTLWASEPDTAGVGVPFVDSIIPRLHYDDILHSIVTTFQILTVANWNDVLYIAAGVNGAVTGLYFYSIIAVGNWMLLNLFIAILIQGFAEQKAVQLQENLTKMQEGLIKKLGGLHEDDLATKIETLFESIDADGSGVIDKFELKGALEELEIVLRPKELQDLVKKYDVDGSGTIDFEEFLSMIKELVKKAELAVAGVDELSSDDKKKESKKGSQLDKGALEQAKAIHDATLASRDAHKSLALHKAPKSLYIFAEKNPIRKLCTFIAAHAYFDKLILSCIFLSSVCLGIERPAIGDESPEREALKNIDVFLNIVFTSEALFKVISLTFKEYIRNGWNRLDFMIVTTSLLDWGLTEGLKDANVDLTVLKIFRIFRIFRALRPLRIIARARGLRILVSTLMSSVKPVMNTVGIALSVFAVFGVLGMQLLSGKMHFCSDPKIYLKENCFGETEDGEIREWSSHPVHFDDIINAIRALFILATQDDWPDHMWAGVDATGNKSGRWQNYNEVYILYYIVCIMVAGYLIVNIFVGVFVDCYNAAASEMEQPPENKKISKSKLANVFDDPDSEIRLKICDIVATSAFDLFIAFFISTNVVTMAMESFKQSEWQVAFGDFTNFFFAFVFGLECAFKMWAFRPRRYFSSGWNRFDFFIVMVSFGGIAIDSIGSNGSIPINPTVLRILRIFRVFRILRAFRIFKAAKGLQEIISTLVDSLPAIVNLFSMLALLFFIYGVLGVQLFGNICVDGEQQQDGILATRCLLTAEGDLLDNHANFLTVPLALLTLFRVSTGDAWGDVLSASQLEPQQRNVSLDLWTSFTTQLGSDPGVLPPDHSDYIPYYQEGVNQNDVSVAFAARAIRMWNETVFGMESDLDWPFPGKVADQAFQWIAMARQALPGCLTDEDVRYFEDRGLMSCDLDGYTRVCSGSCTLMNTSIFANLYFVSFVCMATFVLLQLVIAVLMEQLANNDGDSVLIKPLPGCEALTQVVFSRIYRRWRYQATRKINSMNEAHKARKALGLAVDSQYQYLSPMGLRGKGDTPAHPSTARNAAAEQAAGNGKYLPGDSDSSAAPRTPPSKRKSHGALPTPEDRIRAPTPEDRIRQLEEENRALREEMEAVRGHTAPRGDAPGGPSDWGGEIPGGALARAGSSRGRRGTAMEPLPALPGGVGGASPVPSSLPRAPSPSEGGPRLTELVALPNLARPAPPPTPVEPPPGYYALRNAREGFVDSARSDFGGGQGIFSRAAAGETVPPVMSTSAYFHMSVKYGGEDDEEVCKHHRPT